MDIDIDIEMDIDIEVADVVETLHGSVVVLLDYNSQICVKYDKLWGFMDRGGRYGTGV